MGKDLAEAGLARRKWAAIAALAVAVLAAGGVFLNAGWPAAAGVLPLAAFCAVCGWALVSKIRTNGNSVETHAEAERLIRKQGEMLALALDDTGGWLWETDEAGRLTHVSRGLAAGLGQPESALLGQDFKALFADGGGPGWDRLLLAMSTRQPFDRAVELPLHGRRMWWQITARPFAAADGSHQGYRGAAHDTTAEHLTRCQLAEERDRLLLDSADKSRFLATTADELKIRLHTIVGYGELLLSPPPALQRNGGHEEHLNTILAASRHLQALAADILDATRIEEGSLQLVEQEADAAEICEVAVKMCRDAAEKRDVAIVASVIDGIEVHCDVTRIKQVIIKLVSHALEGSTPGGTVYLDFETPADRSLTIAVHHAGAGVCPRDLARTFKPFTRSREAPAGHSDGTGLRLAIARQIALLHGGDVTIESAEGAGTTARLSLPASRVNQSNEVKSKKASCAA